MNLFVTPPEIDPSDYLSPGEVEKLAGFRLTSPASHWDDEVTQILIREYPFIPADRIIINFKKIDEAEGYGYGYAGITGAPRISIPVVIKARELAPVDVMVLRSDSGTENLQSAGDFTEDKVLPLTEQNFALAQDAGEIGTPVDERDIHGTGYTEDGASLSLPFRGRTVIAEFMGAAESKVAALKDILAQDKTASAGYLTHGTADVLGSWVNAPLPPNSTLQKLASAPVEQSIAKIASGFPAEVETESFLAAQVFTESGIAKVAVKVDTLDLSAPEKGASSILVFEDGDWCRAPEKVATHIDGSTEDSMVNTVISKIASGDLRRGATLMFRVGDHFTRPSKLAGMMSREDQSAVTLTMTSDLGQSYPVVLDRRVKVATYTDDGQWVLPMVSEVFELTDHTIDAPMPPEKVASWFDAQLPDSLVHADGQFSLHVRGETFGASQVDEAKVASVLGSWVANSGEIIEQAKELGTVRFSTEIPGQIDGLTKQAEHFHSIPALAQAAVAEIAMPLDKAVKLAAAIGDPEGVDAVLAAGFLTEDNLAEFVSLTDMFEDVISKLARLLLAIRMGFPGDENATTVAMKSLQRVTDRLQSAVQEVR